MIPVIGYRGHKVAVLGLGRSGLASAAALLAGGAEPLLWDESAQAREKAEAAGYALTDLSRAAAFDGVAALITSPGIPHLYPSPHPIIAREGWPFIALALVVFAGVEGEKWAARRGWVYQHSAN